MWQSLRWLAAVVCICSNTLYNGTQILLQPCVLVHLFLGACSAYSSYLQTRWRHVELLPGGPSKVLLHL